MVNRINIVILIMLFFLPVGRVFARADTLKVVSNAVREPVMLPGKSRLSGNFQVDER